MKKSYLAVLALLLATAPAFAQGHLIKEVKSLGGVSTAARDGSYLGALKGGLLVEMNSALRSSVPLALSIRDAYPLELDGKNPPSSKTLNRKIWDFNKNAPISALRFNEVKAVIDGVRRLPGVSSKKDILTSVEQYYEHNNLALEVSKTPSSNPDILPARIPFPYEVNRAVISNNLLPADIRQGLRGESPDGIDMYVKTCSLEELKTILNEGMEVSSWNALTLQNLASELAPTETISLERPIKVLTIATVPTPAEGAVAATSTPNEIKIAIVLNGELTMCKVTTNKRGLVFTPIQKAEVSK